MAERAEPLRIGVRELRGNLADYLRQAKNGARFLIVSRGQPIAELGAPTQAPAGGRRKLGVLRGKMWLAEDWDEWPEGFLDALENNPIEPAP